MDLCWQNDVSLFNTLSRFVIAFPLRSKNLNFQAAVTISSDFGGQGKKICHSFHSPPTPFMYCEVMGLNAMILVF